MCRMNAEIRRRLLVCADTSSICEQLCDTTIAPQQPRAQRLTPSFTPRRKSSFTGRTSRSPLESSFSPRRFRSPFHFSPPRQFAMPNGSVSLHHSERSSSSACTSSTRQKSIHTRLCILSSRWHCGRCCFSPRGTNRCTTRGMTLTSVSRRTCRRPTG